MKEAFDAIKSDKLSESVTCTPKFAAQVFDTGIITAYVLVFSYEPGLPIQQILYLDLAAACVRFEIVGGLAVAALSAPITMCPPAAIYASLTGFPQAQLGNAPGNYIPNALAMVASAGITLGEKTGLFGTLRWRYLGASPLTEDIALRSPPTSVFNARAGYRFENGWRIQLDALNLLNS